MAHAVLFLMAAMLSTTPLTPVTWPVSFPYDTGSWKKPLQDKASDLEQMIIQRHNIDGLVPTMVTVIDGQANLTTSGHADVSHSVNWTTHYLEAATYRWLTTKDPGDYQRVLDAFTAIHRCQAINGVPGLISRGYVLGHGPSYEERRGDGRGQERWWQGQGEFAKYRWRGNPSHHNHSGYLRAMGLAWAFIDDPAIRAIIKQDCLEIGRRVFLQNDMKVVDVDGQISANLFGWPPYDSPSSHGFMVTSELKVIATVTEDPDLIRYYEKMIDKLHYRDYAKRPVEDLLASIGEVDYDDTDHCFAHLDTMRLIEKDEELIAFYKKFAEALWTQRKNDKQALFNITYHAVTGNDGKIADALWWLKYYPTNKYFQPRMNSIRPDVKDLPKPLPLSERPFDNEYDFKGDPYTLDGWQTRVVTDVKASADDPMVLFACDSGGYMYRSLDGGAAWANCHEGLGGAKVAAVLPSPKETEIVLAATDLGVFRSRDCGLKWTHVLGADAAQLVQDPKNAEVAYAETVDGLYEAVAFDAEHFGLTWRKSGGDGPPLPVRQYAILAGDSDVLFIAQDERNTIWGSAPGNAAWANLSRPFGGRIAFTTISRAGDTLLATTDAARAVAISPDRGKTWSPKGGKLYWYGEEGSLSKAAIQTSAMDPHDASTLYLGGANSFWVSHDGGDTWQASNQGLAVPCVKALVTCPVTGALYAGTPGGLYCSHDRGATWEPGNLVPMFEGVQLIETAPVDYLVAYWMGRYHNVISSEQAAAPWTP